MSSARRPKLEKLSQIFCPYPEILAVYLFGSAAAGRSGAKSDLDLAILARSASFEEKKLEILTELARRGYDRVDLVFLNSEDLVLQYEAVRQNRLVYEAEDFDRGETYSKIVRQYLDFEPYLRRQREAYREKLLRD